MFEIAIMLLPVAAASGWYVASKQYQSKEKAPKKEHEGYFKGLNFLLNEQPDKAIDVFIDLLEVDDETIEIHLALGTLFRQRGEVEKAIRLHQNLIARPQISKETRANALNELGLDYMRAGLLDRAESIFLELEKDILLKVNAVRQLLSIYQQEREWLQAIDYAVKLQSLDNIKRPKLLSHLHCEVALLHKDNADNSAMDSCLKKALKTDPLCVRANVIASQKAIIRKEYKSALKSLLKISEQDEQFVPVFLDLIMTCFDQINKPKKKFDFLAHLQAESHSAMVMRAFIEVLLEQKGSIEASVFLREKLLSNPKKAYLKLYAEIDAENIEEVESSFFRNVIKQFDEDLLSFTCQQCGFHSNDLNWCCPSCKEWGMVNPVLG
jgi:lipopolysaccharide biosynthesis regulator YciM